jgi:hypothetical protein
MGHMCLHYIWAFIYLTARSPFKTQGRRGRILSIEFEQVKPVLLLILCSSEINLPLAVLRAHSEEQLFSNDNGGINANMLRQLMLHRIISD